MRDRTVGDARSGARGRGRLVIELGTEPVERLARELVVAFCFEDDRPLRGPAGRADWRLCGELSRLVARAHAGRASEALLLPTGGHLRARRLMLLGLGPAGSFTADDCARAVRDATRRILDLRVRSVALGPPGDWIDRIPVGIGAQACVRGAVTALADTGGTLEVCLVTPPERVARVIRGLEAAAASMRDRGVSVELPRSERVPPPPAPAARPARAGTPPTPPSSQP